MSSAWLLGLAPLTPLLIAALLIPRTTRRLALVLAPWAALPALGTALVPAAGMVLEVPTVMDGTRLALDPIGRVFLLFSALLWLLSGLYACGQLAADDRRIRFWVFFLLTLAGNLGAVVAADVVVFYTAFALMTFAAYGLVIHTGSSEALRAGRVYIVMAVLGEALLLAGVLLLVAATATRFLTLDHGVLAVTGSTPLASALLFAGFAVKCGLPGLHMWLALAHPVAPAPASAVLSGTMIKVGLLGWMRFLPLGVETMPVLGTAALTLGLLGALCGVAVGLAQRQAKTVLAYSSISQMGFMTAGVGAAMLAPHAWPALVGAISLYALHHGLAKGALFLGVGLVAGASDPLRRALLAGLAVPALALAGAPLSSGALAKTALKSAMAPLPDPWPAILALALPLGALASTLLMLHLGRLLLAAPRRTHRADRRCVAAWALTVLAAGACAGFTAPDGLRAQVMTIGAILASAWPMVGGLLIALAFGRRMPAPVPGAAAVVPPGDLLVLIERPIGALWRWLSTAQRGGHRPVRATASHAPRTACLETVLRGSLAAGAAFLGAIVLLLAAFSRG